MYRPRMAFLATLFVYAVGVKLLPYILMQFGMSIDPETTVYPWNFSPVPAICLFGAAYFQDRRWAFGLPILAWLLGDLGIFALVSMHSGISAGAEMAFYRSQIFVYLGFALVVLCGMPLRSKVSWLRVAGCGVAGSVAFFVLTNFAIWALPDVSRYPQTLAGLIDCFISALPFYRNFLVATGVFSAILFSPLGVRAIEQADESRDTEPAPALPTAAPAVR
ncbi:DUF6580 family putative transport protein [Maioricimonas sp. JC845]|uniref:DUF6580 family putative transport protein n=1 Tax=Maioricimonas sp. JC845 TaxID=3232138 RepID=UPI00345924CF